MLSKKFQVSGLKNCDPDTRGQKVKLKDDLLSTELIYTPIRSFRHTPYSGTKFSFELKYRRLADGDTDTRQE